MKYNIYSIRDQLNGFGGPMCDYNDGTATRNFRSALAGSDLAVTDFDLYRIGTFDVRYGTIVPEEYPVLVFRGVDVRKVDSNE